MARYEATRKKIIEAFDNRPKSDDALYVAVFNFAKSRMFHLEKQFADTGTFETVDDYAQEVTIAIFHRLPGFQGDGDDFMKWLNRITTIKIDQFHKQLKDKRDYYTGLSVNAKDEDGEEDEIDNPEIYKSGYIDNGLYIPESVTGLDRIIVGLMTIEVYDPDRPNYKPGTKRELDPDNPKGGYRGMNYAEIADSIRVSESPNGDDWSNMTEGAVKARVNRIKARLLAEREGAKLANFTRWQK